MSVNKKSKIIIVEPRCLAAQFDNYLKIVRAKKNH